MNLDYKLEWLFRNLAEDRYVAVNVLAARMKLSEKTVRSLSYQLDEVLQQNGAEIEKKYGEGLRILVRNRKKYQRLQEEIQTAWIPASAEQRGEYLTVLFLMAEDYCKIEELCNRLYVSRKTITSDIKSCENFLASFQLKLFRRPHYGLRLEGRELDIRRCMDQALRTFEEKSLAELRREFCPENLIRECVLDGIRTYGYTIYETEMSSIIRHFQVGLYRMGRGCLITMEELEQDVVLQEMDIKTANACADLLREKQGITIPVPEVKYMAIQLSGKKKSVYHDNSNRVIDMEINQLVNRMLEHVKERFQLDFYNDFELHTSLREHLVSLRIRLLYHLRLENPMLRGIRETYSFPYLVAAQAATVLTEHFQTVVNEDEVGYLALCFALAMERQKRGMRKRNIILVCATGMGSARLFEYRFLQEFGEYLNHVETCDINSLPDQNFTSIDYVFSTVPVKVHIPVPIYQVQYFFDRAHADKVKRILADGTDSSIRKYFRRDLFFTDIAGETREEILHQMCVRIGERVQLPEGFEQSVFHREQLMQTDFCGQIAIPHPYSPMTAETFVAVAVLEHPVHWYLHDVQVVFLLSISADRDNLEEFYAVAPAFMMNEDYIGRLIAEKRYETLADIIAQAEQEPQ